MPRRPRIHYPGAVFHVTLRGNGGSDIFFEPGDRDHIDALVGDAVALAPLRIYAFCWMRNHVHLLVQVNADPVSRFMHHLGSRYSRWINRRLRRRGHVFEARYDARLVTTDEYLLESVRYIHLNPVRAGLVRDPADYPWSGHQAYIGAGVPWVRSEWVLSMFSLEPELARAAYLRFLATAHDAPMAPEVQPGFAVAVSPAAAAAFPAMVNRPILAPGNGGKSRRESIRGARAGRTIRGGKKQAVD
ncbi:MAG: transposase [Gammaproteobacteria bacterium]